MTSPNRAHWAIRATWPLLGGAVGAWLGFGGYLRLPQNADGFGTLFALGFFVAFAGAGLVGGLVVGAVAGGAVELALRRLGVAAAGALAVATLVNALVLWQLVVFVHDRYPGLRAPSATRAVATPAKPASRNPCALPPPADAKARALWDSECR